MTLRITQLENYEMGGFGMPPAKTPDNSSGLIPASPSLVTADAFPRDIEDAFFGVVFLSFCLVVAPVAVHRDVRALVAA